MSICCSQGCSPKGSLRQEQESRQAVYLEGDPRKGVLRRVNQEKEKSQQQNTSFTIVGVGGA